MIDVSKNELSNALQKASVGQGYCRGTGQWLASIVLQALQREHPALDWALKALKAQPEPPQIVRRSDGWLCLNRSVLIAGPLLTDLYKAGEDISYPGYEALDVPHLWTHRHDENLVSHPGPLTVDKTQWYVLQKLAAQTYVPTSEKSRQGAGPHTSDCD